MANEAGLANAEAIGVAALGWIAADGELINRFMSLTGIEADAIRAAAGEPGFLAGVLEFLMGHEPTLMRFCEDNALEPASIAKAHAALSGPAVPGPGDFV